VATREGQISEKAKYQRRPNIREGQISVQLAFCSTLKTPCTDFKEAAAAPDKMWPFSHSSVGISFKPRAAPACHNPVPIATFCIIPVPCSLGSPHISFL
jgi:hypothetical protein